MDGLRDFCFQGQMNILAGCAAQKPMGIDANAKMKSGIFASIAYMCIHAAHSECCAPHGCVV